MKIIVVLNPSSGRGAGRASLPKIGSALERHGLDYEIMMTERPMHAAALAEWAADHADIVASPDFSRRCRSSRTS